MMNLPLLSLKSTATQEYCYSRVLLLKALLRLQSRQCRINGGLASTPLAHDMSISKRHYLTGDHSGYAPFPVTPPKEVCYTCPPGRILPTAGGACFLCDHEAQPPALWWISLLRIQLGRWVRLLGLGCRNSLPCEVR